MLRGTCVVEHDGGRSRCRPGRRSSPGAANGCATWSGADGAEYVAVCLPAFSPERADRDDE